MTIICVCVILHISSWRYGRIVTLFWCINDDYNLCVWFCISKDMLLWLSLCSTIFFMIYLLTCKACDYLNSLANQLVCRMDLPGPTTSVGTRTDYSVGPWDYPTCAAWHLMAWSTRTTEEKYSVRKLYMSRTVWKTPRRTRLVLSPYSDL
jgi:hypothetical protein